jgi:branched-chain amino acid aminotransferase
MLEDRIVFLNGDFVKWDQVKVHMMSHCVGRGSAIFEVISVHKTDTGSAIFCLDEHVERLFRTAELLNMVLPTTRNKLIEAVIDTVKRNGIDQGMIKIICFYPQIAVTILPPQKMLDISIFVIEPTQDLGGLGISSERGTTVGISKWRKLDPQTVPIEAKVAANYLNGMLSLQEAKKRGFEWAIMLDTQGFISEGGTEAIFLVKDNLLMTPSTGTVLKSITRKSIIQVSIAAGIETIEKRLHPDLLWEADEIFLSSTPFKVLPVSKIEDRTLESVPGPLTRKISFLMEDITKGKSENFRDWLFHVR